MRAIDLKHHVDIDPSDGMVKIFKTSTGEVVPTSEPTILFRGRDRLALPMLKHYRQLCADDGATQFQLDSMDGMIAQFEAYANEMPTKQPGITRGEKWDGTQS